VSANQKKMMSVMENITKLIRANKFNLECVLYKVGEDSISDAFTRAGDHSDNAQVVLCFPTLQEELQQSTEEQRQERQKKAVLAEQENQRRKEEEERNKLKNDWLNILFTDQSVAAMSPEGPLNVEMEAGNQRNATQLVVWIGDNPAAEKDIIKDLPQTLGSSVAMLMLSWSTHPAGEAFSEFNVKAPEVVDGSFYLRDRASFENSDLDMLHDVELLGRSFTESMEKKVNELGVDWKNVVIVGFGKGGGIALYAALLKLFPKPVQSMILFSPIVLFPAYLGEKLALIKKTGAAPTKLFPVWGSKNRSTPGTYRQLLTQTLRKAPEVQCTPDTIPEGEHTFDSKYMTVLASLLALCMPR